MVFLFYQSKAVCFCSPRNADANNESDVFFQQMCGSLWSYVNTVYTHTTFYSEEVSGTAGVTHALMTSNFPLSVSPSVMDFSHHCCHGDTTCIQINRHWICWSWRMMKIAFTRRGVVDEWCWWSHKVVVKAACILPPARLSELFPALLPERSGSGPGRKGHSC